MRVVFAVEGMSCQHCVRSIEKAIAQVAPSAKVAVDLAAKRVTVENGSDVESLRAAIREAGYEVKGESRDG